MHCSYCSSTIPYGQEVKVGSSCFHPTCGVKQADVTKINHQNSLMNYPNVVGVGVGWRYHTKYRSFDRREICVVVNVFRKLDESQLGDHELIPRELGSVRTDVLETREILAPRPLSPYGRRGKMRPAYGGVSIGHAGVTAGTFGCLVKKGHESLILSNNHVLANEGEANLGDPILQPGLADGGRDPFDKLATLDSYIHISFNYGINRVDAAIARPVSPADVSPHVLEIGTPTGYTSPNLGARVLKSGRTTGRTLGEITQIEAVIRVRYRKGWALFDDQFLISPGGFSRGGDSGSVIFLNDGTQRLCGLLFAGSDIVAVANPIPDVIERLRTHLL